MIIQNSTFKIKHSKFLLLFLLIFLFIPCLSSAQDYFQWRWSHDPILKNPDASALHAIGSGVLADNFDDLGWKWYWSDLTALGFGIAWEVKDGLIPYERAGILGGEGFSVNDLKMDAAGILAHRITKYILTKYRSRASLKITSNQVQIRICF